MRVRRERERLITDSLVCRVGLNFFQRFVGRDVLQPACDRALWSFLTDGFGDDQPASSSVNCNLKNYIKSRQSGQESVEV